MNRKAEFNSGVSSQEPTVTETERGGKRSAPGPIPQDVPPAARSHQSGKMAIDDAILEAVKNEVRAPTPMIKFLEHQLAIHTTINSVRTRLSRLKQQG
jgi:hypothetical protein